MNKKTKKKRYLKFELEGDADKFLIQNSVDILSETIRKETKKIYDSLSKNWILIYFTTEKRAETLFGENTAVINGKHDKEAMVKHPYGNIKFMYVANSRKGKKDDCYIQISLKTNCIVLTTSYVDFYIRLSIVSSSKEFVTLSITTNDGHQALFKYSALTADLPKILRSYYNNLKKYEYFVNESQTYYKKYFLYQLS